MIVMGDLNTRIGETAKDVLTVPYVMFGVIEVYIYEEKGL